GIGNDQPDVPVDSRSGIPARSRLAAVVGAHGQNVRWRRTGLKVPRELVAETDIAVRPLAQVEAVDPDVAIGHHSVEFDEDPLTGSTCRQGEMLAVPAHAGRQKPAGPASWIFLVEGSFDAPIVRDVDGTPAGVVEFDRFGAGGVALFKTPVGIE